VTLWLWIPLGALVAMVALYVIGRKQYRWTVSDTGQSELASVREPYWLRVLVAFDVFCNVFTGGESGETISARCWRWSLRPHGHWVQKFINGWLRVVQADHGPQAASGDLGRAQRLERIETAALAKITG